MDNSFKDIDLAQFPSDLICVSIEQAERDAETTEYLMPGNGTIINATIEHQSARPRLYYTRDSGGKHVQPPARAAGGAEQLKRDLAASLQTRIESVCDDVYPDFATKDSCCRNLSKCPV